MDMIIIAESAMITKVFVLRFAGYKKFGGYGFEANQIRVGNEIRVEPFLIPEEIVKYKKFINI